MGSGYTGFLGLYPALLSQELTRRGVATIALEYPCYGASEGRGDGAEQDDEARHLRREVCSREGPKAG